MNIEVCLCVNCKTPKLRLLGVLGDEELKEYLCLCEVCGVLSAFPLNYIAAKEDPNKEDNSKSYFG